MTKKQIIIVQMAARGAGLRTKAGDSRYRLLLSQYKQSPSGKPVTSCKQLNNSQVTDFLAICEALGWRYPGHADNYCRAKAAQSIYGIGAASFGQQTAIDGLRGDLGWTDQRLAGFLERMTNGAVSSIAGLTPQQGHNVIEALKAMVGRNEGIKFKSLKAMKDHCEGSATDGQQKTYQV